MEMSPAGGSGAEERGSTQPPVDAAAVELQAQAERRQAGRALWRQRRRRMASGTNVVVSVVLAAALTAMLNYAVHRHLPYRYSISSLRHYTLSEKTRSMLAEMRADVKIIPVFREENPVGDEVRRLLQEYAYAAAEIEGLTLDVEPLDPDRDLVRVREVAEQYDVKEADVVVLTVDGRHRVVSEEDMVDYERLIDGSDIETGRLRMEKKKRGFMGEQAISSALYSLVQARRPTVYFLTGHEERDPADFSSSGGYAEIARLLRRENVEIQPLLLAEAGAVPTACDLLVIAGPALRLADTEIQRVSDYLDRSGRVLVLAESVSKTGLDELLENWGVALARDVVVGMTLTGRELVVREYGVHPVTRALNGVITMFYGPRSVEAIDEAESPTQLPADRPRTTALAMTSEGWAERNLSQTPPRFDADTDRPAPVSVAVAVERGAARSLDIGLKPTRVVVVGDADFVSNGALKSGVGGNVDFFLNAVNWLVDREALLEISAKAPIDLQLDMDRRQSRSALALMIGVLPLVVVVIGLAVWGVRRR